VKRSFARMRVHGFGQVLKAELLTCVIYIIVKQKISYRRNKMNTEQMKAVLESYARSFLIAAGATYYASGNNVDVKSILVAGLIAVAGPALRAVRKNDPAFGLVADVVDSELKKLANKPAKKTAKKAPAKKSSGGGKPTNQVK
jgi:hypothetical protein